MVSDVNAPLAGTMNLSIWSWDSTGSPRETISTDFTLAPLDAQRVFSGSIAALTNGAPTTCFFVLTATAYAVRIAAVGRGPRPTPAR